MAQIDYYFSPVSPYTYLSAMRLERIAQAHGVSIAYKPFDVAGLFARTGGLPPKDRHPNRQAYREQDLARTAAYLDLPLNVRPMFWPTNPAPASYAIIAAQLAGGGDVGKLAHALARACWAEEQNVADDAVIRVCLDGAGFDPGLADSGLLTGAEIYSRNLEEAFAAGVFGAPFYVTEDDERFWGQDRLDQLDWHLGRS
ncbi:2-hydroxychromene-2-carboxylate isomerase [Palleronia sp. LCG004]|uniref:2-hydroxychromene-2-carboxylate isomerase n=1 Tax=Palleronia sp. LCG004 TaxID=3079304 RepID=UPI002941DA7B|nr:2-hydroxychromene-2-carboxylate isomerase [Palleronia sp. LCG004]WOI56449.1 2-hydroxychromene-2-carboxylate isomerase [Palleronia sp. LCG004]